MRKWIWLSVALVWIVILSLPIPGVPPLRSFLLYPTSVLQVDLEDHDRKFAESPYPSLSINYDQRGVPHIFAPNEQALAFGMGLTHAKDRQFQLEMLRRTVRGRLAEVAGPAAVSSDRWWLKFDFERKSQEAFEKLKTEDPELASIFEAYAQGFNYFLENQKAGEKAPEFHLLGFEPTPMKAYVPIMLVRYMDKVLTYSENDLKFSALKQYLSDELINYYYPWTNDYGFAIYPELSVADSLKPQLTGNIPYTAQSDFDKADVRRSGDNERGSNNWSVAGEKSATGNSFLCNDTHLGLDLPGTWYEVHQVVNGEVCHGLSIPGAPMVVSGFTNKVAWGMTNATWDLTEFYKLETNDKRQYKLDGQWENMVPKQVTIPVKGEDDATFTYYETYFGPLDSVNAEFLATQWVADNFERSEMRALYDLKKANNLDEAYEALQQFGHPPQNFVLSDRNGRIGMVTAGYALMHKQPSRGIKPAQRKADKASFKHMGRKLYLLDPEKSWNHSANQQQVIDPKVTAYLNTIFAPTARGRRISEMMQDKKLIDRSDLKRMHADVIDGEWPLLRETMLSTAPELFLPYLENWDGACTEESEAATIYSVFKTALVDSIGTQLLGDFDFLPPTERLLYLVSNNKELYGPNGALNRDEIIRQAWSGTVNYLGDYYGYNPKLWQYGKYHRIYFRHIAKLRPFSYPAFPAQGSPRTVNVSSGLPGTHGPAMRTLIELGPEEPKAEVVIAGGQSGIPGHEHYTDQIKPWYEIKYFPIKWIKTPGEGQWATEYKFD